MLDRPSDDLLEDALVETGDTELEEIPVNEVLSKKCFS